MNESIDIRKIKTQKHVEPQRVNKSELWSLLNKELHFGGSKVPDKIKENFYLELWSLLHAGVDIRTALDLVTAEYKKKRVKDVFGKVVESIVNGASLSSALKKTKQFTTYEYFSIQVGEEAGKLVQVLKQLADYFNKRIKQKRQIIGAMIYPVVVLVVAFGAISFMVSYVVPMFSDTFKRFGNDLPAITKAVIAFAAFLKKSIGIFFLIFSTLIVIGIWQSKKDWFRNITSRILLRIPVVGMLLKKIYLARFANTMSLLIGSKIPMLQSIQLTRQMVSFYPIETTLTAVEQNIVGGMSLHKSLIQHSFYSSKMVSIIKVGEEVNQLELFFARISEQYANEVEYQTTMLSKFLEPFIIIVLGIVVGIILIAMYLPLFKLGQSF